MPSLRHLSSRPRLLVDQNGWLIADPDNNIIGQDGSLGGERLLFALPTNTTGGALSLRYHPPHPVGETSEFGMNFDNVVSPGIGIAQGKLDIFSNVVPPVDVRDHWKVSGVTIRGRALFATLSGGIDGNDYQIVWTATDTRGRIWPRTGLILVAQTS